MARLGTLRRLVIAARGGHRNDCVNASCCRRVRWLASALTVVITHRRA